MKLLFSRSAYFVYFIVVIFLIGGFFLINGSMKSRNENNNLVCRDCNVILISVDTLRADHVGAYGYPRNTTPNLDNFAKNAIIFTNVFSQTSWTLPSHATIFTSLYPAQHKVLNEYNETVYDSLNASTVTLAKVMRDSGYKTAAFVGDIYVGPKFGFGNGFENYFSYDSNVQIESSMHDAYGYSEYIETGGTFNRTLSQGIKWIDENRNEKFFVFLHGYDVHAPYLRKDISDTSFYSNYSGPLKDVLFTYRELNSIQKVDDHYEIRVDANFSGNTGKKTVKFNDSDLGYIISRYDAGVFSADTALGNLFSYLKSKNLLEKTIVVVVSDHGENLFEKGLWSHRNVYDSVLQVVMMIHIPNRSPAAVSSMAGLIDVMPTILDLVNVSIPSEANLAGKNLVPAIANGKEVNNFVFADSNFLAKALVVRSDTYKLIFRPANNTFELYNWRTDPHETLNIYGRNATRDEELKFALFSFINETNTNAIQKLMSQSYVGEVQE
ncbi:MAG: sulfatase [Candidatus Aenigmarchaeota archaeon]|nr:sulfatase [Candidatus Aenigmarchaeota archaeon]